MCSPSEELPKLNQGMWGVDFRIWHKMSRIWWSYCWSDSLCWQSGIVSLRVLVVEMKANWREYDSVFKGFESHQSDGVSATTMTLKGINDMILSFDCNDHRANTFTAVCPCFPARMGWLLDWDALMGALNPQTKCVLQRSCWYSWCRNLSIDGDNKSNKDDQDAKSKLLGHGGYLLWKRKIDKSNNNSFLCTRAWDGLWFNPRGYCANFLSEVVHFTANGWGGNEGELFDCGGHDF